jgi:hypothetical protein
MTKQELKAKIDKLENGIKSKATPSNLIAPLKAQKAKLEKELQDMEAAEKKAVKTKKVSKVAEKIKAAKKSVAKKTPAKAPAKEERKKDNIVRDGDRKSLPAGKRTSKTGKVYYETRVNRSDKQTSRKPYLAKGGEINWGEDLGNGFSIGNDVVIIEPKNEYKGKEGFIIGKVGDKLEIDITSMTPTWLNAKTLVSMNGVKKIDTPMADGGEILVKVGDKVKRRRKKGAITSVTEGEVYEVLDGGYTFKLKDEFGNKSQKINYTRDFRKSEIKSMAKGGYVIFEGRDNYNDKPLYKVISKDEDNDYDGEFHDNREDAEKELNELKNKNMNYGYGGKTKSRKSTKDLTIEQMSSMTGVGKAGIEKFSDENNLSEEDLSNIMQGLGRRMISASDFATAVSGNKDNQYTKEIVDFAKSGKGYKMAKGGEVKKHKVVTSKESYADDLLKYADLQNIPASQRKVGNKFIVTFDSILKVRDSMTQDIKNLVYKMANGGKIDKSDELEYESILSVLKEKIDESIEELPSDYQTAAEGFKGQEVEHESRDGFIPYTDGGYEARWFDNISNLNGSGISLPTMGLDAEMQRQVDYNYEYAKDRFKDEYPDIVEELGEDNIDYNSLQENGYDDEAEQLSEWEMNYDGDDTIMMEIGAFYYNPENSRGEDGKHTISLFANVNLESPYHRSGNLDDGIDHTFTFNSLDELKEKMDENLKKIIDWFDGKNYKEGKKDLKITRMAKGGYMADGGQVKVGDILTAKTGVKVKVVEYDPKFGGRVRVERIDEYATGKPSVFMPLSRFIMADGGYMADGGMMDVVNAEISTIRRNIMGTTSFMMKIKGMRNPQDFSVYPISTDQSGQPIKIQSATRFGFLDLSSGRGLMSQSHPNGAYSYHFTADKKVPFKLSETDLQRIKEHISGTAGSSVGNMGISSDNSGASMMAQGGEVKKVTDGDDTYYLTYIDSTHFYLSNSKDYKGNAFHIAEFRSRPFYDEVKSWLKSHKGEMMASGGETSGYSYGRLKGFESQDWEKMAREYAGSEWNNLSKNEKDEIISDLQKDWNRNTSFAQGGEVPAHFGSGRNIDVFGYQTQHFDICGAAVKEFEAAVEIMQNAKESEKESLARCAKYVDGLFGIEKLVVENSSADDANFYEAVSDIMSASIYNYRAEMSINLFSFVPQHLKEIAVRMEKAEKGGLYALGGMTAGRYYRDKSGEEFKFIGKIDSGENKGKFLFTDGQKSVYKDLEDFEGGRPKETKLFGFFEDGGMMAKGGRIGKDWNGRKSKETWGKSDLYEIYDNNLDLVADVHDYYKKMGSDITEDYAKEMKKDMIDVLQNGKIKFNDGATTTFEKGGYMAKGGAIKNQYEGKTASEVWSKWTEQQRSHFLLDHSELLDKDRMENNLGYSRTAQKDKKYEDLTPLTKRVLEAHVNSGQYADGGMMAKGGEISFDNSNLYLNGFGMDSNGNSVVKVSFPNQRAFSIQTNGVLKETNNLYTKNIKELTEAQIKTIEKEVVDYVKQFGSKEQKQRLKTYSGYMAKGGMTRKGGQPFEVEGRKFFYHKDDGNVYDSNHRLYAGSYSSLELAKKSLEKNFENIKTGNFYKDGGYMASGSVIPKGARVNMKIKDWYIKNYPTDELGEEINDTMTFKGFWAATSQGYNPYEVLGVHDSVVRERVEEKLSKMLGKQEMAKGGMTRKGGQPFEVEGRKFFYHKDDGNVYDSNHRLYAGSYSSLELAKKSLEKNFENIKTGNFYKDGGYMASGSVIPKGARVNMKIKDWYIKNYPTDELGEEINDTMTFKGFWAATSQGYNPYEVLGVHDSVVRERVEEKLSKMLGKQEMAKGGIYSSDSLYILKVSKDGKEVGEERFRAKNIREAKEMGEDYEEKYKTKFGGDLSFSVKEAMASGGKVKFADKVKSVQESLLKRKKVAPQVQKDYGKTYSKAEAKESAQRIVGSRMAQLKEKMAKKKK